MKCFFCPKEACAKVGGAKGNILAALIPESIRKLLGWKVWDKAERYICRKHFEEYE